MINRTVDKSYDFMLKHHLELIEKHPEVAEFKSNLIALDYNIGKKQKAISLMKETVKRHPSYILGRVDLVNHYLRTNKFQKAITLLGNTEDLFLKDMIPNRSEYMKDDLINYNSIAIPIHIYKYNKYYAQGKQFYKKRELEKFRAHTKLSEMILVDEKNQSTQVMMRNLKVIKTPNYRLN